MKEKKALRRKTFINNVRSLDELIKAVIKFSFEGEEIPKSILEQLNQTSSELRDFYKVRDDFKIHVLFNKIRSESLDLDKLLFQINSLKDFYWEEPMQSDYLDVLTEIGKYIEAQLEILISIDSFLSKY
jgi:hypothetical protein